MADEVVDVVLQFCATQLLFFDFLVGREINLFFDAIDGVIEAMIFVEHFPEMVIRALEAADGLTMFRKLTQYSMMEVHSRVVLVQQGIALCGTKIERS